MLKHLAQLRKHSRIDLRKRDYIYIVAGSCFAVYCYDLLKFTQSCGG